MLYDRTSKGDLLMQQKCFDIHVIDFQIIFLDTQWRNFFKHWSMQEITKRAAIIHIDIPGQEDDAPVYQLL
jgi:hypothetical protein